MIEIMQRTMKDNQNEFYSSISKYYPEIFPFNPAQLQSVFKLHGRWFWRKTSSTGSHLP